MKSDIKYTYFHNLHYLNNSFEKNFKGVATLLYYYINPLKPYLKLIVYGLLETTLYSGLYGQGHSEVHSLMNNLIKCPF